MSVAAFLNELRRLDIVVWLDGAELRCNAPAGVLKPELRDQLRRRKDDILEFLRTAKAAASQPRGVVPLQQNGTRIPVFAVPGHNGDVFCYRSLEQALGDGQPFFGLQPPGLDGAGAPLTGVDALAEYFAGQVRAFQPDGPCVIGGFCAGGAVAFELARRLGAQARLLVLFGSPYPAFFRWPAQLKYKLAHRLGRLGGHFRSLAFGPLAERRRYFAGILEERKKRRDDAQSARTDPILRLRHAVEEATLGALRDYEPRRYDGAMALLLPCESWARGDNGALYWRLHADRTAVYFGPEGADGDNMLRAQYAPAFAGLFKRACAEAAV